MKPLLFLILGFAFIFFFSRTFGIGFDIHIDWKEVIAIVIALHIQEALMSAYRVLNNAPR